jgi:N-acetylmuramoyl-L-alanine amidase
VQLALKIALRSSVEDVHAIPVGYPIKIPVDVLSEEWLPKEDPRAQELANEKAEASQFAKPAPANGLRGIRVVIDAGHGGRDTGTLHGGVWESTYVYDVACRLRKILADRTLADVVMTTKEPGIGWKVEDEDVIGNSRARLLLTTPPYRLDDPIVGVNLRWYLANAVLRKPGPDKKKIPPERTVFLSLHADSLHPSVRGAMAYVPGERFMRERFGKTASVYKGFKEFRDAPTVSFDRKERVESEGISTGLAEKLITAMRDAGLPVHRFSPVRTHVIRGGREWVPAVLRYNRIPNRVLLEIANLGNDEDRALTTTRRYRQEVAEAVAAGLVDFFGGREKAVPASLSADAGTVQGPWPARAGKPPAKKIAPKPARRVKKT